MAAKIKAKNLDWQVDSAGTSGWHQGEAPDPRSIRIAQAHSLDIRQQQSRQFVTQDFERFDVILAMDNSNYRNIITMAKTPEQEERVQLILEMAHGYNAEVPDPYYGNDGFEEVYQMLDEACGIILEKLVEGE